MHRIAGKSLFKYGGVVLVGAYNYGELKKSENIVSIIYYLQSL